MLLFECEQRLLFKAGIGGLRGFPRHEQLSWFRDLPNEASIPVVLGSAGLYSGWLVGAVLDSDFPCVFLMPGSTARPFGGGLTARWWLGNAANIMYRSHD